MAETRARPRQRTDGAATIPTAADAPLPERASGAAQLDAVIHERSRLGIVGALAANEYLSFVELKSILKTTDGNISAHTRKLEDVGYIVSRKRFEGRLPRTEHALTPAGRQALAHYLESMETLIRAFRRS